MIPPMDHAARRDPKDVAENKDLAALSYAWIASVILLFSKRDSAFVQFHAKQGTVLFVASFVAWAMPFVGSLVELLVVALCIMGFLHAAQGAWSDVPVVGPVSRGSFDEVRSSWKDVVAAVTSLWSRVRGPVEATPPSPAQSEPTPSAQPPPPSVPDTPSHAAPPQADVPPLEAEVPPPALP